MSWLADYLPPILLFSVALGLRSYHLTNNPLWLDEIYGFLLGKRGLLAILQNSLHDPHPPLYYLFQWVASGFGKIHNEWAWRWPSVLFGSLAVPLVYVNASKISNRFCAFLVAGLLAISPAHLYFSQEARAFAFSSFLAVLSPLLIWRIQRNPHGKGAWITLAFLTVIGLYSTYSYLYIGFVQMAYLAILFPKSRYLFIYSGIIVISFLPWAIPMLFSMGGTLEHHTNTPALTIFMVARSMLAGEPLRYGLAWYHNWLPIILGIITVPGIWICLNQHKNNSLGPYIVVQLLLPLVTYFLLVELANVRLPPNESKQFMNLLPVFFITVSAGLFFFQQRLPGLVFVIMCGVLIGVVLAGNLSGAQRYWTITKSPEGLSVNLIKRNIQVGDAIVSTGYSLDAALSFYKPSDFVYIQPHVIGDQIFLYRTALNTTKPDDLINNNREINLERVRTHPRLWLLTRPGVNQDIDMEISRGCDRSDIWQFPPFQVELLVNCKN